MLALLQIIGRFPLSREWEGGGVLVFFWSVCGLFVVAFLFFRFRFFSRFRFFTLTFFSHFHFFSHTPTPHTPPFPRKRESPCDARQRRGIHAFGAGLGDSRFRGNGKGGGNGKRGEGREIGGGGKDVEKVWRMVFWGAKKNKKKLSIWEFFCGLCIIRG